MQTRLFTLIILLAGGIATTAHCNTNNTWHLRLYGLVESFTWEETFRGTRLVREEGPRFGIGMEGVAALNPRLSLSGRGEGYVGEMDYDGGIQEADGTITPITSDTTYGGFRADAALGSPLTLSNHTRLTPLGGFGFNAWLRTLDTGFGDRSIGSHGYEEFWFTFYGLLGGRVQHHFTPTHACFASATVNLPIWNREYADLSNVAGPDDVTLSPEKRTGWSANAGFMANAFTADVYFEQQDFGESNLVREGYFQPASSARTLGGRVGMVF